MTTMNVYLNFNGNTEEAFNFYKSVLGGEFEGLQRFKDTPQGGKLSKEDGEKIMHVTLPIGKNSIMGTDALEAVNRPRVVFGDSTYITLHPETKDEAQRIYDGLSAGGKVETPLQLMFWGAYYASFTDKFGICWMVNCDAKKK